MHSGRGVIIGTVDETQQTLKLPDPNVNEIGSGEDDTGAPLVARYSLELTYRIHRGTRPNVPTVITRTRRDLGRKRRFHRRPRSGVKQSRQLTSTMARTPPARQMFHVSTIPQARKTPPRSRRKARGLDERKHRHKGSPTNDIRISARVDIIPDLRHKRGVAQRVTSKGIQGGTTAARPKRLRNRHGLRRTIVTNNAGRKRMPYDARRAGPLVGRVRERRRTRLTIGIRRAGTVAQRTADHTAEETVLTRRSTTTASACRGRRRGRSRVRRR